MIIKKWTSKDTVCLDVGMSTPYKQKKTLIDLLTSTGCKISFILNKNVKYLIRDDRENLNTYKCRMALKFGIPILHTSYVLDCVNASSKVMSMQDYLISNRSGDEEKVNFTNGIIPSTMMGGRKKCIISFLIHYDILEDPTFSTRYYICLKIFFLDESTNCSIFYLKKLQFLATNT
jgi:hypothetical protein